MITLLLKLLFVYLIIEKDCFGDYVLKSARSLFEADNIVFNIIF